jgi:release factor glutamine methyltransferase
MTSKRVSTATRAEDGGRPPVAGQMWQVDSALRWAREQLQPSSTASLDAQLLLGHVLHRERSWVLAHSDEPLTDESVVQYRQLISRRSTGVPVAYLRGHIEWSGLDLKVTPDVLVPRPETELVVEEAVAIAHARGARRVVDVGTGSGAIAIQLARCLPDAGIIGIDLSPRALEVARDNAERTGTRDRITWLEGDLLQPLETEPDLIVANLPYLSDRMMLELPLDVRHEPILALVGGVTGLELYRHLFEQRCDRRWPNPVVLEIDPRQSSPLRAMLRDEFSETDVYVRPDYAGLDRIVVVGACAQ